MFRGAGFEVIDIGIDVPEEEFVRALKEHHPNILGLSALLTMALPKMKSTVEVIIEADLREKCIIMVGGAPVTEKFAEKIGADGYAPDAASAVDRAKELMKSRKKYSI
jgi:5-methyltetrahydrofolate--homocysteine methyltransferase